MLADLKDSDKTALAFMRRHVIQTGEMPTLRQIAHAMGRSSPRSGSLVVERLLRAGFIKKLGGRVRLADPGTVLESASISTVDVPLVGAVTCGVPMLAEQNIEAVISVSTSFAKPGSNYFLLRAQGNSMDRAGINDGDIVLVRQQSTAVNGDRVVALIDDEATIKSFERTPNAVILRPQSMNPKHKPIVLTENCQIQGVVITTLPANLY